MFQSLKLTAIVTPTVAFTAPRIPDSAREYSVSDTTLVMKFMRHVFLANFLGLPSYSVPAGFARCPETNVKLPVGLQFTGLHWTEHYLLRLAYGVESWSKPSSRTPVHYYSNPKLSRPPQESNAP
jgi:aspartyl-tRNA(Asn)/glutamyl-tRNA(Gln) amidotransferase subunit A